MLAYLVLAIYGDTSWFGEGRRGKDFSRALTRHGHERRATEVLRGQTKSKQVAPSQSWSNQNCQDFLGLVRGKTAGSDRGLEARVRILEDGLRKLVVLGAGHDGKGEGTVSARRNQSLGGGFELQDAAEKILEAETVVKSRWFIFRNYGFLGGEMGRPRYGFAQNARLNGENAQDRLPYYTRQWCGCVNSCARRQFKNSGRFPAGWRMAATPSIWS